LEEALKNKIEYYVTPEKQAHLKAHGLEESNLLVHGDSDTAIYNTPAGHLTLEEISKLGGEFYSLTFGSGRFQTSVVLSLD